MTQPTIYVSGPMTGLPNYNRNAFNAAADDLASKGFVVLNPATITIENGTWEQYMRKDLALLLTCDAVVVLPGWEDSRGARTEIELALKLGMAIYHYPTLREIKVGWVLGVPYRRQWGEEYLCLGA